MSPSFATATVRVLTFEVKVPSGQPEMDRCVNLESVAKAIILTRVPFSRALWKRINMPDLPKTVNRDRLKLSRGISAQTFERANDQSKKRR